MAFPQKKVKSDVLKCIQPLTSSQVISLTFIAIFLKALKLYAYYWDDIVNCNYFGHYNHDRKCSYCPISIFLSHTFDI